MADWSTRRAPRDIGGPANGRTDGNWIYPKNVVKLEEHFPLECVSVHGGRGVTTNKNQIKNKQLLPQISIYFARCYKWNGVRVRNFTSQKLLLACWREQTNQKTLTKQSETKHFFFHTSLSRRKSTTFWFRLVSVTSMKTSGTDNGVNPRCWGTNRNANIYIHHVSNIN